MDGETIRKETDSAQSIWEGEVDGKKTRIIQIAEDDCIVEQKRFSDDTWYASGDRTASHVYMIAFLETRKQLKDVAEFAVSGPPKV